VVRRLRFIRVSSRRRGNDWRGPAGPDWVTGPIERRQFNPTARRLFWRGANNASFFAIPIGIAGGTGPNSGRFGTLGRNTVRGPAYYDFDFALVKTTPMATEKAVWSERICNSAQSYLICLTSSTWTTCEHHRGTGFGMISKTGRNFTANSVSLKLIY